MMFTPVPILWIEHDLDHVRLVQQLLAATTTVHFQLEVRDWLAAALQRLEQGGIALIVAALDLPDSDRSATLTSLSIAAPHLPVLALVEDETLGLQAVRQGAQDYLLKGQIDADLLARVVNTSLARQQYTESCQQAEVDPCLLTRFPSQNPNPVIQLDSVGRVLYANAASAPLLRWWNCKVGEPLPDSWRDFASAALSEGKRIETEVACDDRVFALQFCPVLETHNVHIYGYDITERKRIEDEVWASERKFRSVIEQSIDGIVLIDENGVIVEWNQAQERITGITRAEALGNYLWDIQFRLVMPQKRRPEVYEHLKAAICQFLETEEPSWPSSIFEYHIQRPDGTQGIIQSTIFLIRAERGLSAGTIIRDLTEQKRNEVALHDAQERFKIAARLASDVIYEWDIESGQIEWLGNLDKLLGYEPNEFPRTLAAWEDSLHPEDRERVLAAIERHLQTREPFVEEYRIRRKDGTYRYWVDRGEALWNGQQKPTRWIGSCSDITERVLVEKAVEEQRTLAEALADTAEVINSTLTLDVVWDRILRNVARAVPHDGAYIMIVEGETARVVRCWGYAEHGVAEEMESLRVQIADLYDLEWMATHLQPYLIPNTQTDPHWIELLPTRWVRSFLGAPIHREGRVIGFLGLQSRHPDFFTPSQAERLQSFADQAAIAIHNAQLFAAEHEQRNLAEALRNSAAIMTSTLDPDVVMSRILLSAGQVVPHDAANIMLIEGQRLRIVAHYGYEAFQEVAMESEEALSLNVPHFRRMYLSGLPFCVSDTATYAGWVKLEKTAWIRSYVGAPIQSHGKVIGFLNLDSATPGFFTQDHAIRLEAFADQAAIALENAQLYAQIRHYTDELEQRVKQRTAELNHAKERAEAILNNASDPVVLALASGTVREANRAAQQVFGYQNFDALTLADLFDPASANLLMTAVQAVLADQQIRRIEAVARRSDGTLFDVEAGLSVITSEPSRLPAIICTLRDITERKRIELALRDALQREKELSELKSRFVSMTSHEFRTPLATILATADTLRTYRHKMDEEQINARLRKIGDQVKHMAGMLDDVLTVGRAQAGRMEFKSELIDVVGFCQTVIGEFQDAKTTHELVFTSHCPLHLDAYVDEKLMRQILTNLLSNAIKYSPPQSRIDVSIECDDALVLRVQDRGIGIPPDDQKHLFDAFHRGTNVGNIGGSGLGLTVARHAVELHGGTITCDSEVGVGTTITVRIPLAPQGEKLNDENSGD